MLDLMGMVWFFGDPLVLPMLGKKGFSVIFRVRLSQVSRLVLAPKCRVLGLCSCLKPDALSARNLEMLLSLSLT